MGKKQSNRSAKEVGAKKPKPPPCPPSKKSNKGNVGMGLL